MARQGGEGGKREGGRARHLSSMYGKKWRGGGL